MPYELRGNCVHKIGDDTPLKCYDNHADALKYLRALEANVTDAQKQQREKAFIGKLEPEDVGYIPVSTTKNQMCASCRWFQADNPTWCACYLVDSSDDDDQPILATGWCDRWEANAPEAEDPVEALAETIVEAIGQQSDVMASTLANAMPMSAPDFANTTYEAGLSKAKKPSFKERLLKLLRPQPKQQSFSIFKDAAGTPHWHAVYTNNFKDREDEILTEAAHDKFIARLDMGLVTMPTLQAWHTPGSDHGKATCIWRDGHMVHAVGDFDDTPMAQHAIQYYEQNAPYLKMSHMFEVPDWAFDGKHYVDYNTIEITTLPPEAAANPYTSFEEFVTMATKDRSPEKSRYLELVLGKEGLAQVDAASAEVNKNLEAMRLQFKSNDHTDPTDTGAQSVQSTVLSTEHEKALKEVYADLVTQVNEHASDMVMLAKAVVEKDKLIKAQAQALKDFEARYDAETKEWQKAWDMLAKQVNIQPTRASQNPATGLSAKDILKAQDLDPQLNGDNSTESWLGGKVKVGVMQ